MCVCIALMSMLLNCMCKEFLLVKLAIAIELIQL